jgi:hypothetical protein
MATRTLSGYARIFFIEIAREIADWYGWIRYAIVLGGGGF